MTYPKEEKILIFALATMIFIAGTIMYLETKDIKTKTEVTVIKSGCVTHIYKGHDKYDCSVIIDDNGTRRKEIIMFGVLPDDVIYKIIQTNPYLNRNRTWYER